MTSERSVNAIDKLLGERMRARRLVIGMSQERLAGALGVSFQQVQKYEKGMNRIAASRLFVICSALDVPIARFLDGLSLSVDERSQGAFGPESESCLSGLESALSVPGAVELVKLYGHVESSGARRRIIDLVRAMSGESARP